MRSKLNLFILLLTVFITACGDSDRNTNDKSDHKKNVVSGWTRYHNADLGFSGLAPANWKVQEKAGEMLALSIQDAEDDKFREYFALKVIPITDQSTSLDSTAAYNMAQAQNQLDSFDAKQFDKTMLEGIPCYEAMYAGVINNMKLVWHTLFLIKDDVLYTLVFNYELAKEETYMDIGYKFMQSFTFKPIDSIEKDPEEIPRLSK